MACWGLRQFLDCNQIRAGRVSGLTGRGSDRGSCIAVVFVCRLSCKLGAVLQLLTEAVQQLLELPDWLEWVEELRSWLPYPQEEVEALLVQHRWGPA
jgi:hypothetical protein